jgi:hypothetical protein
VFCRTCYLKQVLQKHLKYGNGLSPGVKPLIPLTFVFEKSLSLSLNFIPKIRIFVEKSSVRYLNERDPQMIKDKAIELTRIGNRTLLWLEDINM